MTVLQRSTTPPRRLDWVSAGRTPWDSIGRRSWPGVCTGGYYAFRIAHTHADRLVAVVAQGSGCHHMFDAEWIGAQNQMEYPFALAHALAYKFGYRDPDPGAAVARYAAEAHKFSLVDSGMVGTPTCRLLVITASRIRSFLSKTASSLRRSVTRRTSSRAGTVGTWAIPAPRRSSTSGSTNTIAGKP